MSLLGTFERFLRSLALLSHHATFIILHIIEYVLKPIYFPIFGNALTKLLGRTPNEFLTHAFVNTAMYVCGIKVVGLGTVDHFLFIYFREFKFFCNRKNSKIKIISHISSCNFLKKFLNNSDKL